MAPPAGVAGCARVPAAAERAFTPLPTSSRFQDLEFRTRRMPRLLPPSAMGRADARRYCTMLAAAMIGINSFGLLLLVGMKAVDTPTTSALDRVLSSNTLRVGTTLDYAPYSLRCPDGTAAGADIEYARLLATSLNARLQIVETSWSTLLEDAASNKFDVAVGGITITLSRLRHVGMSKSASYDGKVPVAPCGSVALELPLAALNVPSTRVVVNPGGTNQEFVRARLPFAHTVEVEQNEQWALLGQGEANLTVTDAVEGRLQSLSRPGKICTGTSLWTREEKAFLIPSRSDMPWRQYIDAWLQMHGAGSAGAEYAALVETWVQRVAGAQRNSTAPCRAGVALAAVA